MPEHLILRRDGAVLGEGADAAVPEHYGAPLREQRRLLSARSVVDLGQHEVLEVSGADHLSWLTTTTSQVLTGITPGESRMLAVLSPRGRVEHLAAAAPTAEGSLLLITDAGAREGLLAYLTSMRFAARVELTERDDLRVLGALDDATAILRPQGLALPDPVALWRDPWPGVAPGGVAYGPDPEEITPWVLTVLPADGLADLPWGEEQLAGMQSAEALRIANHRPRFTTEVDERSIPHELDLLRTAVHTEKGCYRGQETVAKVLNLGQPPRRLVMLHLDGSSGIPARPGGEVRLQGPDGKVVGVLTSTALHADLGPIGLAVVRRAVPLDATLSVAADGALVDGSTGAGPEVWMDATQEAIVLPREHGERPGTARL